MTFSPGMPSPWAKSALKPHEYRTLRDLPHPGHLSVGASGPHGPYWARYAPRTGKSGHAIDAKSPFLAALSAIEKGLTHAD